MPTTLIASLLVSSFAISATSATVIASVATVAIGFGVSIIGSLLSKGSQPKPSDGQVEINSSAAPRFRSYGRVKVAGNLVFANTINGFYGRILAMGSGPIDAVEQHWLDDHLVVLSGEDVTSAPYVVDGASRAFINFRLGEDNPALYAATHASFPELWTIDHLGRGVPSAEVVLAQTPSKVFTEVFPQGGDTLYRQVQRGALIRDIAGGAFLSPAWSDSAALVIADFLTHPDGMRLHDSWVLNEADSWVTAHSICNDAIPAAAGGTEGRYKIWSSYDFSERPADVLTRFLQACDAVIYPTPNRGIAIKVGKWEAPTVTIDDDAIIGYSGFGGGRDILTTANTIRARYMEPSEDYQETDAEIWADDADIALRGEIAADFDFFCAPNHSQCRRLMKIAAYRANPEWVGTLTCNLRAMPVMGERWINVVLSELGVSGTFEVLSTQFLIDDGSILSGIEIQVQSMPAYAYDWTVDEEGEPPGGGNRGATPRIAPLTALPPLTGFDATANGLFAVLRWDAPPSDSLTADIEYQVSSEAQWSAWPVADGATAARLGPLVLGTKYAFRARTRSELTNRVSDWSATDYITIGTEDWVLVADALAATVDLDFSDDLYFHRDKGTTLATTVSVARSAVAYADDKAGVWTSFAANTPRRTDRGLLVEEARTNGIRNNSMQGAVAGTPGTRPTNWGAPTLAGLTTQIVGIGTVAGIDYIDIRLFGTTTGTTFTFCNPEAAGQIAAAQGQAWTSSFFLAVVGGSTAGLTLLRTLILESDAALATVTSGPSSDLRPVLTSTLSRIALTYTLPSATAAWVSTRINGTVAAIGAVVDLTLRIGWPQLEQGGFATSPIRTTSAAVTRGSEIVTLTAPPTLGAGYTLYARGTPAINGADQVYVGLNDGSLANTFSLRRLSGNAVARLAAGGSTADLTSGAIAVGTPTELAAAYQRNAQALSRNGAAAATGASALVPAGMTTLSIGHGAIGTAPWNGYVERVALWPANRISNAGLQTLTS